MAPSKYICGGCGFTYEETKADIRAGMPPKTPFAVLSDDWRCPNCHAAKSMFHSIAPVNRSSDEAIESAEDVIAQLQAIAEHEKKSFSESKSFVVPVDYLGDSIHELALKASRRATISERRMLSVFFDEGAIKLLRQKAVNYYWFWRIVHQAAMKASKLPMGREQVENAICDLRTSFAQHMDLEKPLVELDQAELALHVVYGLIVLKLDSDHCYYLQVNPLFDALVANTDRVRSSAAG